MSPCSPSPIPRGTLEPFTTNNTLAFEENTEFRQKLVILDVERNKTMNPAAALSRSVSGNHLSFRSNLQGVNYHLSGPAPAATRRGVRRSSESLSFRCRLYADDCESNCMMGEGKFGFDYAKERLEKRQMFLRSYHFTTEAEEASTSNNRSTLSQKGRACLFRIRTALLTVIACNPPRAFDKHHSNRHVFPVKGFVRIHPHANA